MIIGYILNKRIKIRFLYTLIFCSSICQEQNLIQNHSCGNPLVNGEVPFWQEVSGMGWTQRFSVPLPFAGNAFCQHVHLHYLDGRLPGHPAKAGNTMLNRYMQF